MTSLSIRRYRLGAVLGLAAAALLSAAPAAGQTTSGQTTPGQITLRVANWLPPTHPLMADIIKPWTDDVARATDGRVTMDILAAPLGPPPAHFGYAVNGVADVTYGVHTYTPGRFVATTLAELPFLSDSAEALSVAYWDVHEAFLAAADEHKGTHVLSVFTHGPGQLWTRGRDLTAIDGLAGLKIRIGGGLSQEVARALDLVPVQAPVTKAYELLAGGVADGIQLPAESVAFFNIQNVVDSGLVVAGGLYNVSFFVVMNGAAWAALPAADQAAIMRVSGAALARRAGRAWDAADARGIAAMQARGITIRRPDAGMMTAIRERLAPVTDQALEKIGGRGIDAAGALAALRAGVAAGN